MTKMTACYYQLFRYLSALKTVLLLILNALALSPRDILSECNSCILFADLCYNRIY
jgi:hypothetical protein